MENALPSSSTPDPASPGAVSSSPGLASALDHAFLGTRFGRYECLLRLASGGMGQVAVARLRTEDGVRRIVALKTIHAHLSADETFTRLFRREAEIASRLHHPNVVPVLEMGRQQGGMFLVMDYFPSRPLTSLVRNATKAGRVLPASVVASLVADVAAGLHAVHELTDDTGASLGLVHRDVTPSNLLVGVDGAVKLTDFGVAKATGGQMEAVTQSSSEVRGKLGYLSPEQVLGDEIDRRSDLFSLGVVLFELLAGRRLFPPRSSDAALLRAVLEGPIPDIRTLRPDCPDGLAAVVARALSRDRGTRFQTAMEVRVALAEFASSDAERERAEVVRALVGEEITAQQRAIAHAEGELTAREGRALAGAASAASAAGAASNEASEGASAQGAGVASGDAGAQGAGATLTVVAEAAPAGVTRTTRTRARRARVATALGAAVVLIAGLGAASLARSRGAGHTEPAAGAAQASRASATEPARAEGAADSELTPGGEPAAGDAGASAGNATPATRATRAVRRTRATGTARGGRPGGGHLEL